MTDTLKGRLKNAASMGHYHFCLHNVFILTPLVGKGNNSSKECNEADEMGISSHYRNQIHLTFQVLQSGHDYYPEN